MGIMDEVVRPGGDALEENKRRQDTLIERAVVEFDDVGAVRRYRQLGEQLDPSQPIETRLRAARTVRQVAKAARYIDRQIEQFGEATVVASLGTLPRRVLDVVRLFIPNEIAPELVDIQQIDQKVGEVFVVKPRFSQAVPGVLPGDEVFRTSPTYANYASEINAESMGTGDGSDTTFAKTLGMKPVRPRSVRVTLGSTSVTDDGNGAFAGAGMTGTVNYATGAVAVTFTAAPAAASDVEVTYRYSSEIYEEGIREVEIDFTSFPVEAQRHPLRFRWSVDAQLTAAAAFNVDVEDTVANVAAQYIKIERDHRLIRLIRRNAVAYAALNFDASLTGISYAPNVHYGQIGMKVGRAESAIQNAIGRGGVDWIVAGANAAFLFEQAPGFQSVNVVAPIGAHVIGTLKNGQVKVVKVTDQTVMPANDYIAGYKGYMFGDASIIIAEFLPLYFTPVWQTPTFSNQQGVMSMYDILINQKLYLASGTVAGL